MGVKETQIFWKCKLNLHGKVGDKLILSVYQ